MARDQEVIKEPEVVPMPKPWILRVLLALMGRFDYFIRLV